MLLTIDGSVLPAPLEEGSLPGCIAVEGEQVAREWKRCWAWREASPLVVEVVEEEVGEVSGGERQHKIDQLQCHSRRRSTRVCRQ